MTQTTKIPVEIRRHNGKVAYGEWLMVGAVEPTHGEIPAHVYDEVTSEALETGEQHGHIVVGGQHYDWRVR